MQEQEAYDFLRQWLDTACPFLPESADLTKEQKGYQSIRARIELLLSIFAPEDITADPPARRELAEKRCGINAQASPQQVILSNTPLELGVAEGALDTLTRDFGKQIESTIIAWFGCLSGRGCAVDERLEEALWTLVPRESLPVALLQALQTGADLHKLCDWCHTELPFQHPTERCPQCHKTYDRCGECPPSDLCFRHGGAVEPWPDSTAVMELTSE